MCTAILSIVESMLMQAYVVNTASSPYLLGITIYLLITYISAQFYIIEVKHCWINTYLYQFCKVLKRNIQWL